MFEVDEEPTAISAVRWTRLSAFFLFLFSFFFSARCAMRFSHFPGAPRLRGRMVVVTVIPGIVSAGTWSFAKGFKQATTESVFETLGRG